MSPRAFARGWRCSRMWRGVAARCAALVASCPLMLLAVPQEQCPPPKPPSPVECAGLYTEASYGCLVDRSGISACVELGDGGLDCAHAKVCACPSGMACESVWEGQYASPDWQATCYPAGGVQP